MKVPTQRIGKLAYSRTSKTEAPNSPAVVDVVLKLQESNNAWVRRGVFVVGATILPDQAARLQPLMKAWLSTGFGWRTDPRDLLQHQAAFGITDGIGPYPGSRAGRAYIESYARVAEAIEPYEQAPPATGVEIECFGA